MSQVIAIIGGGFSGTVLAANLLRHCRDVHIVLIERAEHLGRGIAYAEHDVPYVLNVPAGRLSADSREPRQFLDYARLQIPGAGAEDFLPRALYGRYLQAQLAQAERECAGRARFERLHDEALDVTRGPGEGFTVTLRHGPPLVAARVVLAVGVPVAAPPAWSASLVGHPAFYADPWRPPRHLDERHTVLILGNGLTMADVVVGLSWQHDAVPMLHTLSRHGLLPQPQTEFDPGVAAGAEMMLACAASARQLLRLSRAYAADLQSAGGDWREVVTLIRQLVPRLWRSLPHNERRRFLRHLRVYWDAHRHRMPPQIAAHLERLKSLGRLATRAGRVRQASALGERIRVSWAPRGSAHSQLLDVDALIVATGPDSALARSPELLMQSLRRQDLLAADALDLGLRVSGDGECLNAAGQPVRNLYYLGPLLRADLWEATAVTELRNLAEQLAQRLCSGAA